MHESPEELTKKDGGVGTYSDATVREAHHLPLFNKHIVGEEEGTTVQSQYSHVYDGMIGRYLFSRLTKAFCLHYPQYTYETVAKEIASRFRSIPNNPTDMFPATTYRFGASASEQEGNDVTLVDSGEKPEFR